MTDERGADRGMRTNVGVALITSGALGVGIAGGYVATHHHSGNPSVKVLGEQFAASGSNGKGNGGSNGNPGGNGNGNANGQTNKQFAVADSTIDQPVLFPGSVQQLPVTLSNPNNFTIIVTGVTTSVGAPKTAEGVSVAGCSAGVVTVDNYTTQTSVPANGTTSITLTVRMSDSAPDACKSVHFPLTYTGSATK